MTDTNAMQRCGAKNRDGSPCRSWPVRGATRCRMHGGSLPQVRRKITRDQQQQVARDAMVTWGLPVDVDPHTALLQEVKATAGHVLWLRGIVQGLEQKQVTQGVTKTVMLPDGTRRVEVEAAVNTWVSLYQRERDLLRRVCTDAIRAGVEERRVRIEEEMAGQLVAAMRVTVSVLGHDPMAPEVRAAVRRGFEVIEGEQDAA